MIIENMINPFHSITLKMKEPTNKGNKLYNALNGNQMRLDGDLKYSAITLTEDGGKLPTRDGDFVVGVLLESFAYYGILHRVCVKGIVPMQIKSEINTEIKPGDKLMACSDGTIKKATTGKYAFGIALSGGTYTSTTDKPIFIPVLLGGGEHA